MEISENNDLDYLEKYIKYKTKYLELKINSFQLGGNRYSCNHNKNFADICYEEDNGKYKTKNKCINDCQIKYINKKLILSKLKKETLQFTNLFRELLKENIKIYLKGGNLIGLMVLKTIYDKYPGNSFDKYFNEFLKLELIRDWDFFGHTNAPITDDIKNKLNSIAFPLGMVSRAKTFILYQTKYPINNYDKALFEISILENDKILNSEFALTISKIKISNKNLLQIFMLAESFYSYYLNNKPIDIDFIKYLIKDIEFFIPKHKKGLIYRTKLETNNISPKLLYLITNFSKNDITFQQFLITHLIEPNRLFYRLLEKNIPKSQKITVYFNENNISIPSWIIDYKYILNQVQLFIEIFSSKIYKIYINNKKNKKILIEELDKLFEGIKLIRIQLEFKNIKCEGRKLLKILFERIYKDIITEKNNSELVKLLIFLNDNGLFRNEN